MAGTQFTSWLDPIQLAFVSKFSIWISNFESVCFQKLQFWIRLFSKSCNCPADEKNKAQLWPLIGIACDKYVCCKKTFAEIIVALLRRKNTKQSQLCAVCPNYRGIERQSRNTIPTKGKRQNFLFWETTIDWGTAHSRPTTPNSDRFAYLRLLCHGIAFI